MADSTIYRFITMALSELSINKSGRHIIRRGIATNELANGKDIGVVALELGHESPNTTFKHYVKNNKELMMKRKLGGAASGK
jgi:integrase/recombinase XerD